MDHKYDEKFPRKFKIICSNYPKEFNNDKNKAKAYFRLFGQLKRITFKPKSQVCIAEYVNKEGMLNAFHHGGEFNGERFDITIEKSPEHKKKRDIQSIPENKSSNLWLDKDDIKSELEAMSGIAPKRHSLLTIDLTDSRSQSPKQVRTSKLKKIIPAEVKPNSKETKLRTEVVIKTRTRSSESFFPDQMELVNLILSRACTVEEKYRILDAKDKLIRAKLKKQSQLKSSATIGSCPDMCPEKERLMRETQHQVALYEQEDNGRSMDQQKAVKQYSRSSADQEAPLSHELRPVSVLQMTMGYLMHTIVDLCETDDVNLAEWYHFLWDRTRGIRKDITQQELCCQGAVELVEQCARFHIHCSARLVAEDPSVFDQKINTENLTKCLQTLKYMYHDLHLKGEVCQNEAEFRGYIILLNLNDGNFMWEVQQLQKVIQKSQQVRFAIEVYSSVDKNNYVKFFKLVRSTTYFNACILMRYFVQVRVTAVKMLLKCYSPRALKTVYPLDELVQILAFDHREAAIEFFQMYNISFNEEKTHISIEKDAFKSPESPFILDRSINIVESKRMYSVGKEICGKDLPPKLYETHLPQNSFDENGMLIAEDILDESDLEQAKQKLLDNLAEEPLDPKPSVSIHREKNDKMCTYETQPFPDEPLFSTFPKTDSNLFQQKSNIYGNQSNIQSFQTPTSNIWNTGIIDSFSKADAASSSGNIFNIRVPPTRDSLDSPLWGIPPKVESKQESIFQKPVQSTVVKAMFIEPVPKIAGFKFDLPVQESPVTNVPVKNVEINLPNPPEHHKQSEEIMKKIEEHAQRDLQLVKQKQLVEQRIKEALQKEAEAEQQKIRKRKIVEEQLQIRMKILEEEQVKEAGIKKTVAEVLDILITNVEQDLNREEKLGKIRTHIKGRTVRNIFKKWYNTLLRNKRKRKAVDCYPMWINSKTLKQSAADLYMPEQNLTLLLKKRYINGQPMDIEDLLDERVEKINLHELTRQALSKRLLSLSGKLIKNIFWKVAVSLPDEREMSQGLTRLKEILSHAFCWKENNGMYTAIEQVKVNPAESITYCIEGHKGINIKEPDANGIIFIADKFNPSLQERITNCLKQYNVHTRLPIVIILQSKEVDSFYIEHLKEDNIISDYIILSEKISPSLLVNVLEDALLFLASKLEKPPPLELDTFASFVEKYLCTEIWRKANSFAKWNCHYKTCLKDPNIVISLYNEGLNKLINIISEQDNRKYMSFPEIFKDYLPSVVPDCLPCSYQYFPKFWKSVQYTDNLIKTMKSLEIPKFDDRWPPTDELELEITISKYCEKIFVHPVKPFYRLMSILLQNIDPNRNFDDIADVLWSSVIEVLGFEKLKETDLSLHNTEYKNKSIYHQFIVVYETEALKSYIQCDWYYLTNSLIKKKVTEYMISDKTNEQHKQTVDLISNDDIENTICEVTKQLGSRSNCRKMVEELETFNALMKDLETSIRITQTISSRFEEEMEKAIRDN